MNPTPHHPYYYKFLNSDLSCTHGKGGWSEGKWMPIIKGDLRPCANGYHVLTPGGLVVWLAPALWRVEVRLDWEWKDKGEVLVVRQARLHSKVEQWNETNQRLIAAEFAQWAVNRYWTDKSDTRPQKAINAARKRARGEPADYSAAGSAARSAARSVAYSAAGSAAYSAAWSAAGSAAWSAARSAAWSAADSAAWSPAWSELNEILINWLIKHD